ncbi:hypothetical protein [Mycoplasma capricolum]|uniref:hypothetical protein n=1 Tax=Mycoplasma capricolum TaxID=2095 RepID=UPI003DA4B87C
MNINNIQLNFNAVGGSINDLKSSLQLADVFNKQMQTILNIVYPTIAGILFLAIIIPTLYFYIGRIFNPKIQKSVLLQNWTHLAGSILLLVIVYAVLTSINKLLIEPQTLKLKEQIEDNTIEPGTQFTSAIQLFTFVIANIALTIIIGVAQLSILITYIIWLVKKSSGKDTDLAKFSKTLFIMIGVLVLMIFVYVAANIAFNQYLVSIFQKLAEAES